MSVNVAQKVSIVPFLYNRWLIDENGKSFRFKIPLPSPASIVYDDIVDRSSFRPDSEQVRQFHLSGSGSINQPVYDKPDSLPTDLEIAIRSGKLDKAEISQLEQAKAAEVEQSITKAKKDKAVKEAEDISKARQEYLDKATGFTGVPQSDT